MTMTAATEAPMSMMSFPLSSCQRPTLLANVVLSVPQPYSMPMTDAAKIRMGMTIITSDPSAMLLTLYGRVNTFRASSGVR